MDLHHNKKRKKLSILPFRRENRRNTKVKTPEKVNSSSVKKTWAPKEFNEKKPIPSLNRFHITEQAQALLLIHLGETTDLILNVKSTRNHESKRFHESTAAINRDFSSHLAQAVYLEARTEKISNLEFLRVDGDRNFVDFYESFLLRIDHIFFRIFGFFRMQFHKKGKSHKKQGKFPSSTSSCEFMYTLQTD